MSEQKPRTAPPLDDATRARLLSEKPKYTYYARPHDHDIYIPGCPRCDLRRDRRRWSPPCRDEMGHEEEPESSF